MKTYLKQKFILIVTFLIFYFSIELIAFLWVGFKFLPSDFLIDLILSFFVISIIIIIPNHKISIIYMSLWLLFINALFVTNVTIFSAYKELFTFEQFKLIGEATDILNLDYFSIPAIIVFLIITTVYVYIIKKIYKNYLSENDYEVNLDFCLKAVFVFLILSISSYAIFSTRNFEPFDNYNEDTDFPTLKRYSLGRYGFLGYYYKEIDLLYFSEEGEGEFELPVEIADKTDYFGLLDGYNVFTIMIESGENYTIHPDLTPNLYQFSNDGLNFPNHYSENKTNVSEVIGINGHYPSTSFDTRNYIYNFDYSLPAILNEEYETAFFHDNYPVFYQRGDILEMIGFEDLYFHSQIYPDAKRWEWDGNLTLDSYTAEAMLDLMFKTDDPFYYFWTTLSTHGPYNEGEENKQLFIDLGYYDLIEQAEISGEWTNPLQDYDEETQERMKFYQAAMMNFDDALGIIIDELKLRGEYDNTLFVLYGDHSVYYHDFNTMTSSYDDTAEYYEMDIYTSLYTIYNETLTNAYLNNGNSSTEIEKFVSPYTVAPTILELLGKEYNENLFLGSTIFSDMEHVFYSNKITTFFTDMVFSDDGVEIIYERYYTGPEYLEEFRYQAEKIKEKLNIINEYYFHTKIERNDD
ncbi:MAG: sulfatase-like hydrolase/transferase [Candidatus Izemoplasmatales bacterium]